MKLLGIIVNVEGLRIMHLRLYYRQLGGHVHCRLFSAPQKGVTHAKNGDLVFDEVEWPAVCEAFSRIADVKPESEAP
jgi:hypothetical protein